ncbi:MAG: cupin domain-containing protein [Halobacteriales archaeon]
MAEITNLADPEQGVHAEVFEGRQPRTVRLHLEGDQRVPPHTHPDTNIVIHLLSGRLELTLDHEQYELEPNDLVHCSGDREISPYALEPSVVIVVIAPRPG